VNVADYQKPWFAHYDLNPWQRPAVVEYTSAACLK
jgi:hypothetical protein